MIKKYWCIIDRNNVSFEDKVNRRDVYKVSHILCKYKIKGKNPIIVTGKKVNIVDNPWGLHTEYCSTIKIKIYNPIMEIQ